MSFKNNDNDREALQLRRLFAAADLLLASQTAEDQNAKPQVNVWLGDPADAEEQSFTYEEFVDAMVLLIRLGLVVPNTTPAATPQHNAGRRKGGRNNAHGKWLDQP